MVSLVCSDISAEAWNVLTSLPTDPDRDQCVINKSITLNGFNVSRTSPDLYSIIAAANVIPGYGGAEDLVQILTHISRDDNSCHVHRPGKVLHYLKVCIMHNTFTMFNTSFITPDLLPRLPKSNSKH